MTYSPECVAAFEAKFGGAPEGCERMVNGRYAANNYHSSHKADIHNAKLEAFAANWEPVKRLENALRAFVDNSSIQANHPHECEQAEELLEKGNE